jgi:uncharacterized membrane protein YccC
MKQLVMPWLLRSFDKTAIVAAIALCCLWLLGQPGQRVLIMLGAVCAAGTLGSLLTRRAIARGIQEG